MMVFDHDGLLSAGLACTKNLFPPSGGDPENKKVPKKSAWLLDTLHTGHCGLWKTLETLRLHYSIRGGGVKRFVGVCWVSLVFPK